MKVKEIMTKSPTCCRADASLQEVARMMVQHDCGCIPVVEVDGKQKLVGVITDRDICCRAIAQGKNPLELKARDCMSAQCITVSADSSIEDCCDAMARHGVRRIPVLDADGGCCGIVAQADIARHTPSAQAGEVVKEVSRPGPAPARSPSPATKPQSDRRSA